MSKVFKGITKVFKKVAKVVIKIAPIVLAAAAIIFTGGAALGLTGTLLGASLSGGFGAAAAGWVGSLGLGATASAALTGAVTYAGYGAVTGGALAGITGGDINKGMQTGALTGAVTGGVLGGTGLVGVGANDAISKAAVGIGSPTTGATGFTGLAADAAGSTASAAPTAGTIGGYTTGGAVNTATNQFLGSTAAQSAATGGLVQPGGWLAQNGALVGTTLSGIGTGLLKGSAAQDSAEATLAAEREKRANIAANYATTAGSSVGGSTPNNIRYVYDPRQGRIVSMNT